MAVKNRLLKYKEDREGLTAPQQLSNVNLTTKQMYTKLRALYDNNGLYDVVKRIAYDDSKWLEAIKPYRTVAHRSVEFYVAKVLPGLEISTENQSVMDAIDQFHKWSNLTARKQVMIRWCSRDGDLFYKVQANDTRVWLSLVDAFNVTDFTKDDRDNINSIRIDIPVVDDNGRKKTNTEFWDARTDPAYMAIWVHERGESAKLDELGTPTEYHFLGEFGIDFVPIIHTKFSDVGEKRGKAAVSHCLDKIDEANREVTRLTQMLFRYNKALMTVSANAVNPVDGSPIPVDISDEAAAAWLNDESILKLTGQAKVDSLIPNIKYLDALEILRDMMHELEQDLPELKYYSLEGDLSGKAVTQLLAGAIDRAGEVQENMLQGLVRADKMALTLGKIWGLFPGVSGTFDDGSFDHDLTVDEMFSDDLSERAATLQLLIASKVPLASAMKLTGFSQEEIDEATQAANSEAVQRNQALATGILSGLNAPQNTP